MSNSKCSTRAKVCYLALMSSILFSGWQGLPTAHAEQYTVDTGQTMSDLTLNAGDRLTVNADGIAKDITVEPKANVTVKKGATVENMHLKIGNNFGVMSNLNIQGTVKNMNIDHLPVEGGFGLPMINLSRGAVIDGGVFQTARIMGRGGEVKNVTFNGGGFKGNTRNVTMSNIIVSTVPKDVVDWTNASNPSNFKAAIDFSGTADHITVKDGGLWQQQDGSMDTVTVEKGGTMLWDAGDGTNIVFKSGSDLAIGEYNEDYEVTATVEEDVSIYATTNNMVNLNNGAMTIKDHVANNMVILTHDPDNEGRGKLYVLEDGTSNNTILKQGGREIVKEGGKANNTTVNENSKQHVWSGSTATGTIINNGGLADAHGDNALITGAVVNAGGTLEAYGNGVLKESTIHENGILKVGGDGIADGAVVEKGGILDLGAEGQALNIDLQDGYILKGSLEGTLTTKDGKAGIRDKKGFNLTLAEGSELAVDDKTAVTETNVNDGGVLNVNQGGYANNTHLNKGGVMNVAAGGATSNTEYNGGTENVLAGAEVNSLTINDGVQNVYGKTRNMSARNGGLQIIHAGGVSEELDLSMEGSGKAMAGSTLDGAKIFSRATLDLEAGMTKADRLKFYNNANLYLFETDADTTHGQFNIGEMVSGGVNMYVGEGKSKAGREVTIDSLEGSINFTINTDLTNGVSDHITVNNVLHPNGSKLNTVENTVKIGFDPKAELGEAIKGTAPVEFLKADDTVFVTARDNQIGSYTFIPVIHQENGSWFVDKIELSGSSDLARYNAGMLGYNLGLAREGDKAVDNRLFAIRQNKEEEGLWATMGRTKASVKNDGYEARQPGKKDTGYEGRITAGKSYSVKGRYTDFHIGYDKKINDAWIAGGVFDYIDGSLDLGSSTGSNKAFSLGAYGSCMNDDGSYLNLVGRIGKYDADFDFRKPGANGKSTGDFSNWGISLAATYGLHKEFSKTWYAEPELKLAYTRLNGDDFTTSDGAKMNQEAVSSFMAKAGVTVGTNIKGTDLYMRTAYGKEFKGDYALDTSSNGLQAINVGSSLKDTWFEYGLGVKNEFGRDNSWYAEIMKLGGNSDEYSNEWRVKVGASFHF